MTGMDHPEAALDMALPITPQVYWHLRERIIRNDLTPGNRISEAEIARGFGVSRQPVREAFIKLAEQGLVAVQPQRGTIVTRIAYRAVLDARFVREAIEADIVAILARAPDAALLRDLRWQLSVQRQADPRDSVGFMQMDDRFHRSLAEGAGKGGAWWLLEGLKSQMDRVRFLALGQFPMARLIDQHEALVHSIEAGQVPAATQAIRHHLRAVLRDLPRIQADNPGLFEMPEGGLPVPVNAPIMAPPQAGVDR